MATIRVLVAEGNAEARNRLSALLESDPEFEIAGEALSDEEVVKLAKQLRPDVVAMSVDLPKHGGVQATKEIMVEAPTPVVIVSDETAPRQVENSILALRAGALAVVAKPSPAGADKGLVSTVKAMSQVKVVRRWRENGRASGRPRAAPVGIAPRVIAIAASTGGPAALQSILSALPSDFSLPILVVQHIASGFVDGLVNWLNAVCSLRVKVAENGEPLFAHNVYVAPDRFHLGVSGRSRIALSQGSPVDGFRPSASYLFESVAKAFGSSAIHVILTGMGHDGVTGLKAARKCGGTVIAQDEASSVVAGMPGAAVAADVVHRVLPLSAIAQELIAMTDTTRITA